MKFILPVVCMIILMLILLYIRNSSIKGFTRGIAKAQLRCFRILKRRNPHLSKRDLLIQMISNRPGYNKLNAESIIKRTEEFENSSLLKRSASSEKKQDISLRNVVIRLIDDEFVKRTGNIMDNKRFKKMYDEVVKIIPDNL